ncbi:MAG: AsmA family protein [Bacteroidales bacterium]|nr:AsmA family protein [Bacteroidales bacterium]
MKKLFKILAIVIVVIFALLFTIPYLFKDKIFNIVKEEINNNLNAKVEFADFSLSFFKKFPNLNVELKELSVVGVDEFEQDTLVSFNSFSVQVDVLSLMGDQIKVKGIILDQPRLSAVVLKDGKANWDIMKETGEEEVDVDTVSSGETKFNIGLKKFLIKNANIKYDDKTLGVKTEINDLNFDLKGDFTQDITILNILTTMKSLTVVYGGVKYLSNANIELIVDLDADLVNSKFTFKENVFKLNALVFAFDGFVEMPNDDINMDITLDFKETKFKDLLSLIPAIFMTDFEELQTSGKIALNGFAKGTYNENSLPVFDLNLIVDNAMFKYPDLPKSVDNINIDVKVSNQTGVDDDTKIDINLFHFELAQNPVDINLHLTTPVSDPGIKAYIKGEIDFNSFKDVIPVEDMNIAGIITADINFDGNLSTIENEEYEEFNAGGEIKLTAFEFKTSDFPEAIKIPKSVFIFSPQYLNLESFYMKIGESDFNLSGKIENYLPYVLKDGTIHGDFKFISSLINVNEFMLEEEEETVQEEEQVETDTVLMEIVEIPDNIDFKLTSELNKIIYDDLEITNINGLIIIKDNKVLLDNLLMNMLDGSIIMTGGYSTQNITEPLIDFDMDIKDFDISKTYSTFNTVKELAPGAKNFTGKFSTTMTLQSPLDKHMEPVLDKVYGKGILKTKNLVIENSKLLMKIGDALKSPKYEKVSVSDVNVSFTIEDGRITLEPFDTKIASANVTMFGSQGIDQTMDYTMAMKMPRSDFGGAANNVLNNLSSDAKNKGMDIELGDEVKIDVLVGGTVSDPKVTLNLADTKSKVADKAKEEVTKKAKEEAQKLIAEAKAKADKIMAEAEKNAKNIKSAAKTAGDKIIKEADANGKNLIKKAGSNPLKKKAAQETAKKMNREAKKKADNLNKEADKKSNAVLAKARQQADKIIKDAEDRAK